MSKPDVDPFYSVRDHVHSQIERLKTRHDKYQSLIMNTDTSVNTEFKELRKTLVKDVRAVDKDLKGLKEAVDMIEKNRAKFSQIKDPELASRKKFVDDSQNSINAVKNGINSKEVLRKIEEDERKSKRESYDETTSALNNQLHEENTRFIKGQKQQTQQIIRQQDDNLAILGNAVDRVGEMAKTINTEVKEQAIMLDGLDQDINDASSRLTVVQEALGKLLKTKDGCQIWTIVILAAILILLIALVIWT